jgi:hypothetical protein
MFIYKNKPNIGKICRTVNLFVKLKTKIPISGRLSGEKAGSLALPTPKFPPIRRYLSPDLAVGSANG